MSTQWKWAHSKGTINRLRLREREHIVGHKYSVKMSYTRRKPKQRNFFEDLCKRETEIFSVNTFHKQKSSPGSLAFLLLWDKSKRTLRDSQLLRLSSSPTKFPALNAELRSKSILKTQHLWTCSAQSPCFESSCCAHSPWQACKASETAFLWAEYFPHARALAELKWD